MWGCRPHQARTLEVSRTQSLHDAATPTTDKPALGLRPKPHYLKIYRFFDRLKRHIYKRYTAPDCRKKSIFEKCSNPNPKPLPRGEGLCMLCWLCIVQSLWAYTPGIRAGAECGAAALTKQGRLKSVAHSRCTMQRHQRLTNPHWGYAPNPII